MEVEWMRSMMTVIAFATFIAIVAWAWSARKRGDFDQAAHSILIDNDRERSQSAFTNKNEGRRQ